MFQIWIQFIKFPRSELLIHMIISYSKRHHVSLVYIRHHQVLLIQFEYGQNIIRAKYKHKLDGLASNQLVGCF